MKEGGFWLSVLYSRKIIYWRNTMASSQLDALALAKFNIDFKMSASIQLLRSSVVVMSSSLHSLSRWTVICECGSIGWRTTLSKVTRAATPKQVERLARARSITVGKQDKREHKH